MFQKHIKPKCYLSILVFLFCTLLCFPQTKKEVKQWEKLQKKVNKFGHYEKKLTLLNDFIQKYPNHFYLEKANSQIEGIVYEQTKRKNTLEVYRDYLEKYPKGKNATEANEKVIDFVFKETKKKKKIEAYKKFLELYPDSKYTAEVKKKLEEMEEAKRIKFKVFSEQIIRGKNSDIVVEGKKLDAIDSVKIIPPEGIFVKGIKPGILNQKEKEMGQKRWLITLFAEKNSALSKRTLVLNTPNGLTKKNTIEIVSYLPIISNLKIISTSGGNRIKFSLKVVEKEGEISSNPQIYTVVSCGYKKGLKPSTLIGIVGKKAADSKGFSMSFGNPKGGSGILFAKGKVDKIIKRDKKTSIIQGSVYFKDSRAKGKCWLTIQICNDKGYKSNDVETGVNFN